MNENKKSKLFIENFLIYGLGSVISNLIPFVMLPIITRIMPDTAYYGLSDLANTIVQLGSAVAIMGMYDAMYRMFFEKEDIEYRKTICSTTFAFTILFGLLVTGIMIVMRKWLAINVFKDVKYSYLVIVCAIAAFVSAMNGIISAPTRMKNKRITYVIVNAISPLVSYSVALYLLLQGEYVIALPIGALLSAVMVVVIFGVLNRKWFYVKNVDFKCLKPLLAIAVPLFPNFLIYWLFNSCDKFMITGMLGVEDTGIYSVGAKLGYISQLIYTAFAGGWQYFAFSTMNEKQQVKNNSVVFEYLGVISFVAGAWMCALSHPLFEILFDEKYKMGYILTPYLFMAPLVQMLFQVACNQFLVIKKTWPNMVILFFGVIVNVVLNRILLPVLGIEGAAVATLAGYVVSVVICVVVLCKMNLMVISGRFVFAIVMVLVFFGIWRMWFHNVPLVGILMSIGLLILYVCMYRLDLLQLLGKKDAVTKVAE